MNIPLSDFLGAFYPDENEPLWFLGFPAKKLPDGHQDKRQTFKRNLTRKALSQNELLQTNIRHSNKAMGMYFVVNAGGTEKKDINRINAVFCEFDDMPISEQHEFYNQLDLLPSIRVETLKSVHAYWLTNDMTVEQWESVQCALIERFKTDAHLKNSNRVMRLPHFNHVSWNDGYHYKKVVLHTFDPDARYTAAQLQEQFPHVEKPKPKYIEQGYITDTWEGIMQELRYRISRLPSYRLESGTGWATAKGVCHDGKNNTALSVNLRTGAISCKSSCSFDQILNHFGLTRPEKKTSANWVSAPAQSSELYQYLTDARSKR